MMFRILRLARIFLLIGGLVGLAVLAGGAWLLGSSAGLQQAAVWAETLSEGRLQIEHAEGRLLEQIAIERVRWQSADLNVEIRQFRLSWSPSLIPQQLIRIDRLAAFSVKVSTSPSSAPTPLPHDLQWPAGWSVRVEQWRVDQLQLEGRSVAENVSGQYASDGRQHRLESLSLRHNDVAVEGSATLDGRAPFALTGQLHVRGQLAAHPLAMDVSAQGTLARFRLVAVARQGVEGQAQAVITPLAVVPYESLQLHIDQLEPAAWVRAAPQARLRLQAEVSPEPDGLRGRFSLLNRQPGAWDQQRIPLISLSGQVRWQKQRVTFSDLLANLPAGGRLSGHGVWAEQQLQLSLVIRQLNLEQWTHRLRPTRLDGTLTTTLSKAQQVVRLAVHDAQIQLQAEAIRQGERLKIPQLKLAAREARLDLQGELQFDAPHRFSATGHLQQFDPSRFAKLPAARINADWQAKGVLSTQPQVDARFTIHDSQIVQQPLRGQGVVNLAWPKIPRLEIELQAGRNRLQLSGAYGQAGDRLLLGIEAGNLSDLAGLGLEGGLIGKGELVGVADLNSAELKLQLAAEQLGWRGHFHLAGMKLALQGGAQPSAPLNLDLAVARLDLPEQPTFLRNFHLQGDGSLAAHRLRVTSALGLAGQHALKLAVHGGWSRAQQVWNGQWDEGEWQTDEPARDIRLLQPAVLSLSANRWQLGEMVFNTPAVEGRVTLQAQADPQQMGLSFKAAGSRMGQVQGQLQATMQGAWSVARNSPWQGALHAQMPDLSWLASWLGEGWASGGRLQGDLQVAGTPAHPLVNGRLQGTSLSLQLPEQGLTLARGTLDVALRDNLLQIHQLGFDSLLQALPRALQLTSDESLARLTARPGRLEILGELRLDQQVGMAGAMDVANAAHAWLDLRLDRVGVWQRADQWLLVSGRNRLGWKAGVLELRGLLTVDAGYWQLARMGVPRLSDDVIVRRAGSAAAEAAAQSRARSPLRPRLDLDMTADLGSHFLFEGAGLSSGLGGQVRLTALGRDLPRASGVIRARDGQFEAYGQKLEIERGILRFNGLLDNPGLDVRALRKGLAVEPGVQISGTAQKPVVKLIAEPDLPETEKLVWLVLGHGSEQMGVGDAPLLLSAAGDLLGNGSDATHLVGQLRKTFGIDEIGIRQGALGDNGSGTRAPVSRVAGGTLDTTAASNGQQIFSISKRLSPTIWLSYEQAMGKAESLVKLTLNLSKQISVIGRAGSDNAIDLLYTLSFGKAQSSPASGKAAMKVAPCSGGVDCTE